MRVISYFTLLLSVQSNVLLDLIVPQPQINSISVDYKTFIIKTY